MVGKGGWTTRTREIIDPYAERKRLEQRVNELEAQLAQANATIAGFSKRLCANHCATLSGDRMQRADGECEMCEANEKLAALQQDEVFKLLERIIEKLHIALPILDGFVAFQAIRSGNMNIYDGPSLEQELKEADTLIAAISAPPPSEKGKP